METQYVLIALAVNWLIMAIVAMLIAEDKGRNGNHHFFITLLIGVFGLVLIGCLSRREAVAAEPSGDTYWKPMK